MRVLHEELDLCGKESHADRIVPVILSMRVTTSVIVASCRIVVIASAGLARAIASRDGGKR
jgi:hypothetical protein